MTSEVERQLQSYRRSCADHRNVEISEQQNHLDLKEQDSTVDLAALVPATKQAQNKPPVVAEPSSTATIWKESAANSSPELPASATVEPNIGINFALIDRNWLMAKLQQLNLPSLRLLLVQLPQELQLALMPLLNPEVVAKLLCSAGVKQRQLWLRSLTYAAASKQQLNEIAFYYNELFTAARVANGWQRLLSICQHLPATVVEHLAEEMNEKLPCNPHGANEDNRSLERLVAGLNDNERALLLCQPRVGRAMLQLLNRKQRRRCAIALIGLSQLPLKQRRQRLHQLLQRRRRQRTMEVSPN